MGELIRVFDWENTVLGRLSGWPQTLVTIVNMMLQSPVPMVLLWGADGIMLYNDQYAVFAGARHPFLLGSKVLEGWPEVADFNRNVMDRGLKGQMLSYKDQQLTLYRNSQAEEVWLDLNYSPILDEKGSPAGVLAIVVDTTRQVMAEQDLRESEARFRSMAEGSEILISMANDKFQSTYFNKAWSDLTGRPMEDLLDLGWADLVHPDDIEDFLITYRNALERQESFDGEFRILNAKGEYRWLLVKVPARYRPDGSFAGFISTCVDITDRKQAEEEKEKLVAIIEESLDFVCLATPEGELQYLNSAALEILGWDAIEGRKILDCIWPDDRQYAAEILLPMLKAEGSFSLEYRFLNARTQQPIWMQWNGLTIKDPVTGELMALAAISPVIAERKRFQSIINGQKKALESAVHGDPLSVVLGAIAKVAEEQSDSELLASILLIDEDGQHLRRGGSPSLPAWYNELIDGVEIGPEVGSCGRAAFFKEEVVVQDIANAPTWVKFKNAAGMAGIHASWSTPIFSSRNVLLGVFSVYYPQVQEPTAKDREAVGLLARTAGLVMEWHQDIQRSQAAQERLTESEERFRTIANAAPNFVWTLGPDGRQTYLNDYGLKFLGIRLEQIIENNWVSYLHPDDIEPARQALKKAIETRTMYRFEHRLRRADGGYRWVLSSADPSFLPNGELHGYVGSSIDITDRKEVEEELLDYSKRLERSNKELEEFATIASHDLSEPLRKIQAFAEILEDHVLEDGKDYLKRMSGAANRMRMLIDDLLTLSRVNRKGKPFKAVNLDEVLQTVLDDIEVTIRQTNATVQYEPLATVQGDENQIHQLLQNLVGNAIKYHRDGVNPVVTISGRWVDNYYEVTVADNALGIQKDYYERIFEPFQRLHGMDKYPGTGMGLAICRKIVERHGGAIWLQSELGRGSQFTFTLRGKA